MKSRILYFLFIPLVLFSSCGKDFTTLSPESERSSAEFYTTSTDFNTAVKGAYSALQLDGTFGLNYVLTSVMRSDNTSNGGGASGLAAEYEHIDQFQIVLTSSLVQETWSDSYKGISRSNRILDQIDDVDFNNSEKEQYKGEALFIRSLIFYKLAVTFGNIPLKLKPTEGVNRKVNQVSADKVYAQIIDDLEKASDLLPDNYSEDNTGRATSWAAKALLGKVYLTNGQPGDAKTPLNEIVTNGPFQLAPNYSDIYGPDNENNVESIFEVQFQKGGIGEGSYYTDMFTPLGTTLVGGGNAPQQVTESIHDAYDKVNDKRFKDDDHIAINDTSGTNQPNWWVPKYASAPSDNLDASNNWIVLRYADVLLMLAEAEGAPGGYDYIDEVRSRAGLGPISRSGSLSFEEKLLKERRLELSFEGKRWADLLRFGKAKEAMANQLTQQNGTSVSESDIHLLFPIPQQEIDAAENLEQNSEY